MSVIGEFLLPRMVYRTREKQPIHFVPLDQQLSLPESEFSYLLQQWDQLLRIEHAYCKVLNVI